MSLCDIFPDDPSCAPEPEPVVDVEPEPVDEEVEEDADAGEEEEGEEVEAEEKEEISDGEKRVFDAILEVTKWEHIKQLSNFAQLSPLMSNIGYFLAAGGYAGGMLMQGIRYRSASDYYDGVKIGTDTNWWKSSDMIRIWGGVALGGTLAVTQLLATLGIMVNLNAAIWMLAGLIGLGLGVAVGVMRFLGAEASNDQRKKTGDNSMYQMIRYDATEDMLIEAALTFAILDNAEGWYYNLWNHQTAEERADAVAEWEETVATRAEEYASAKPAAEEKSEEDAEEGEEAEEGEDAEEGEEGDEEAAEEE